MKILSICAGVPGSGKSFVAKALQVQTNGVICSTDDFFMIDGIYKFDPSKLGVNHAKNVAKAEKAMQDGIESIIIDNTNVLESHRKIYSDLGKKYGYLIQYIEVKTDLEHCIKNNAHGVPAEAIRGMAAKYQPVKI